MAWLHLATTAMSSAAVFSGDRYTPGCSKYLFTQPFPLVATMNITFGYCRLKYSPTLSCSKKHLGFCIDLCTKLCQPNLLFWLIANLIICINTVVTWQRQFFTWNCQTMNALFYSISNKRKTLSVKKKCIIFEAILI